jgi:Cu+-exporting ATPase
MPRVFLKSSQNEVKAMPIRWRAWYFFYFVGGPSNKKPTTDIAFDRDYKSFFPLAVTRKSPTGEQTIDLASLQDWRPPLVRNGELIPADSRLVAGTALIDYSFVTGESEPAARNQGGYLYAGGQQVGGSIEVETVKPVSQSYLTSLWNDEAFRKERTHNLNTLTNRYSRRFTRLVILVAASAALFWTCSGAPARGLKAFTSVLIVACPCALALAAPFALGTAQRLLARRQIFLKNAQVLEHIAQVDAIVFDKTGTLTSSRLGEVSFHSFANGRSSATPVGTEALTAEEIGWVRALTVHSAHPHSRRIAEFLRASETPALPADAVLNFVETPGRGLSGTIDGNYLRLGSREWMESNQIDVPNLRLRPGSASYLTIDNRVRGAFVLANSLRPQIDELFSKLAGRCELTLLSGDNQKERARFSGLFGVMPDCTFTRARRTNWDLFGA